MHLPPPWSSDRTKTAQSTARAAGQPRLVAIAAAALLASAFLLSSFLHFADVSLLDMHRRCRLAATELVSRPIPKPPLPPVLLHRARTRNRPFSYGLVAVCVPEMLYLSEDDLIEKFATGVSMAEQVEYLKNLSKLAPGTAQTASAPAAAAKVEEKVEEPAAEFFYR